MKIRSGLLALILVLGLFVSLHHLPNVIAGPPYEPPFQSQLRPCFENNKDTSVISSESAWNQNRPSVFPNHGAAVKFAKDCRRSICGTTNSVCCNTFCKMSGFAENSGSFYECQRQCAGVNGQQSGNGANNGDPTPVEIPVKYEPCEISCNSVINFYNFESPLKVNTILRGSKKKKTTTQSIKKLIKKVMGMIKRNRRSRNVLYSTDEVVEDISTPNVASASVLASSTSDKPSSGVAVRVFKKSLNQVYQPTYTGNNVPKHRICSADSTQKAVIEFNAYTGMTCPKIREWLNLPDVSPNVLQYVEVLLYDLYGQCRLKGADCSSPRLASIKYNDNVLVQKYTVNDAPGSGSNRRVQA
ncbi:hypothetical protein C9374_014248 [Naegleria lovaniensis]|uniref:Uncharacterized protein n=1 Tax=Naegleria lovaniensis TaxID=51637 RepID=A0AA88GB83_NAELO|nr:uncharacterized protein C9374_014248 [Naegleria lovaniensis]KAG2370754.1 hypothetical protein C9374_014248 [Naegleria lovaniensis]